MTNTRSYMTQCEQVIRVNGGQRDFNNISNCSSHTAAEAPLPVFTVTAKKIIQVYKKRLFGYPSSSSYRYKWLNILYEHFNQNKRLEQTKG